MSVFIFPRMGSSKLIAIKPRNHLETQTSAYTLVAYGERQAHKLSKSRCIYIPKVEGQGRLRRGTTRTGRGG